MLFWIHFQWIFFLLQVNLQNADLSEDDSLYSSTLLQVASIWFRFCENARLVSLILILVLYNIFLLATVKLPVGEPLKMSISRSVNLFSSLATYLPHTKTSLSPLPLRKVAAIQLIPPPRSFGNTHVYILSKIQLVVYYQCCVLIG